MLQRLTPFDRLLDGMDHALAVSFGTAATAHRPNPAAMEPEALLGEDERRHAAGLMRVNHAGEVCAQALYLGQGAVARDPQTRAALLAAADEEADHLAWCAERLAELASRPSRLDPFWYAGAWAIGAAAGLGGDGWNLGFVVETERQVEAHLGDHLAPPPAGLPATDVRSRAIVRAMQADERRHADRAEAAGARILPGPVRGLMRLAAGVMKRVAYRI